METKIKITQAEYLKRANEIIAQELSFDEKMTALLNLATNTDIINEN